MFTLSDFVVTVEGSVGVCIFWDVTIEISLSCKQSKAYHRLMKK